MVPKPISIFIGIMVTLTPLLFPACKSPQNQMKDTIVYH